MLKKEVTYTDYNGEKQTETFYFNLSEPELARMQFSKDGTLSDRIQKIVSANSIGEVIGLFEEIIQASYGVRSEDGKRFHKSPELTAEFAESAAYSAVFMDIVSSDDSGAAFVSALVPADLLAKVQNSTDPLPFEEAAAPTEIDIPKPKAPKDMTKEELLAAFEAKNNG